MRLDDEQVIRIAGVELNALYSAKALPESLDGTRIEDPGTIIHDVGGEPLFRRVPVEVGSGQHGGKHLAPKVGEARWPPCFSPILALMIAGLAALARPVAAEIWGADCWPLRVEYNFNNGSAVISFLTETRLSIPVAAGRITYRGTNPDGSLYAYANFPGGNNLITVNINTRELFVSSDVMGARVCVANTYVAP